MLWTFVGNCFPLDYIFWRVDCSTDSKNYFLSMVIRECQVKYTENYLSCLNIEKSENILGDLGDGSFVYFFPCLVLLNTKHIQWNLHVTSLNRATLGNLWKIFLKKELQQFFVRKDQMKKDQECLFRQSKNSSPLKYILLLIFQIHKHFSTSFWSTKQVERHLTGFSFDIIDIIKTPKIEAIFARKLQFHIKTKTNNTAFAVLYHPSHMSKGGKQYKYHIFIQKCILPWKTENKNAFKVQYVLCQHNKHEQQQLYARSGNGVGWCLFVSKKL